MVKFRNSKMVLAGMAFSLLLAGTTMAQANTGGEPGQMVSLRWALGALDTGEVAPNAIKRDTQLPSGARLKFLVEPLSPGSVYLILQDSDQQIHVLYQESTSLSEQNGKRAYIPPGSQWFEVDDKSGLETFFLLASTEPLLKLEKMLAQYKAAAPSSRKSLGTGVIAEIRRLHKTHRDFARPVEKPVMIGGQTRGGASASVIDRLAVEISAEKFYGKTITIDH